MSIEQIGYMISIWALPILVAITFHEAAHGYVAMLRGDKTAYYMGRVSFNPLKHIDPFGTLLLPGFLIAVGAPFVFGYAKPVPVDFSRLYNPKRDMVLVAAAGPAINIALAILAALLINLVPFMPDPMEQWANQNLQIAMVINVVLALFNLIPLPPLDGGRIAVGLLPRNLSRSLDRIEPYGFFILIGAIFLLPALGNALGMNLDIISGLIRPCTQYIMDKLELLNWLF